MSSKVRILSVKAVAVTNVLGGGFKIKSSNVFKYLIKKKLEKV